MVVVASGRAYACWHGLPDGQHRIAVQHKAHAAFARVNGRAHDARPRAVLRHIVGIVFQRQVQLRRLHKVLADDKPRRFANRNPVDMGIADRVAFNQDIAVGIAANVACP